MSDQDNRHPRTVNSVVEQEHESLGWAINLLDPDVRLEDGRELQNVDIQLKPHPNGYQYTLWWKENGEKKQRDGVIRFSDPRDELRAGIEKAAGAVDGDTV